MSHRMIKTHIRNELLKLDRKDFLPGNSIVEAVTSFSCWAFPAFCFVVLTRWLNRYTNVEYLNLAIAEGIGPRLWNIIGSIGFLLFGLFVFFPRAKILATAANKVLDNAYQIGALSFGLMLGQSVTAFVSASLERWQAWAYGFGFGFLFFVVFVLNLLLWYLSYLAQPSRINIGFANSLSVIDFRVRALVGILPFLEIVLFLVMKR